MNIYNIFQLDQSSFSCSQVKVQNQLAIQPGEIVKTKTHGVEDLSAGKGRNGRKFARQDVSFKMLVKKHATYVSTHSLTNILI